MAISDYLEGKIMGNIYNGTAYTPPTSFEVALYSGSPLDDNSSGLELVGGSYERRPFVPTTAVTPAWIVSNSGDIVWPAATSDWATATYVVIFDQLGNMLDYGLLTTPKTVLTDGIFKILDGELDIQYN